MAEDVTGGTAQFQEVLELRVDLDLFKQEMGKVAEVYSSSLQGLGNVTLGTSDVIVALKSLESQFERLSEGATKSVTDLTSVMLETAHRVEEALNALNGKVETTATPATAPDTTPASGKSNAVLTEAEQGVLYRSRLRQKSEDEEAAANEKSLRALAQFEDAKQASDEKIARLHAQILEEQQAQEKTVREKSLRSLAQFEEAQRTSDERIARLHAQILEEQAAQEQAVREKTAKAYAQYEEQRRTSDERIGRLHAQVLEQEAAQEQSVRDKSARAYAQYDAARQKLASQVPAAELPADFFNNQPLETMRQKISQIKEEMRDAAKAKQGLFGTASIEKFIESLKNIPNMIANVLALNLAWKAAGLVIEGVASAIEAPFKAVKDGVQYVRELQTATADLQGSIAGNITLSKDYAVNFKLAGDAAEVVRKKLEDVAISTGLTVQGLQSAFKQLAEGGGGSFVTNIDQLVDLTQMFGQAMKAAGKDVNATRTLLSEIPALLAGNEAPSSKLLEVLHLTKDQWEAIRLSALKHHDLVQQLAPLLKPYLDVADEAGNRQEALINQLDLIKKRIEGAFSQQVFTAFTDALQTAKNYLQDQEGSLTSIGQIFADLVVAVIEFGKELVKTGADDWLKVLAQLLNLLTFGFKALLNVVSTIAQTLYAFRDFDLTKPFQSMEQIGLRVKTVLDSMGEKLANDLNRAAANAADIDQNTTRYRDQIDKQISDRNKVPAEAQGEVIPSLTGSQVTVGVKPTVQANDVDALLKNLATSTQIQDATKPIQQTAKNNRLQTLREELTTRVDLIKQESQEELDSVNRLEHLKDISSEEASKRRVSILDAQLVQISDAADSVLERAQKSGLNTTQIESLANLVTRVKSLAAKANDKSVTGEEDKNYDKQYAQFTQFLDREQQAFEAHQKAMQGIDQELADEGLITNEKAVQGQIDSDNRIYQQALKTLDLKIALNKEDADTVFALTQQKTQLEQAYTDRQIEESHRLRDARNKDRDAEFRYENQKRQLEVTRLQDNLNINNDNFRLSTGEQKSAQVGVASAQNDYAQAQLEQAKLQFAQALADASKDALQNGQSVDLNSQALRDARLHVDELAEAARVAAQNLQKTKEAAGPFASTLEGVFGQGKDTFGKAFGGDSFSSTIQNVGSSIQNAVGVLGKGINAIQQGVQSGGVLGGIGAGLQSFGGLVPVAGPFIQAAGAVMSLIGGLFTSQAQHIADKIKKEIDQTLKDINNGVDTSSQGLLKLEQERQEAITKLSGKKGGKKQLDQLLPGLDDAIAQLKKQIADVKQNFEDALSVLKTSSGHSEVFTQWISDWQNINKQVKDYLDAVGAAGNANAQAFLSLQLAAERSKLQDQFNEGESQAIQDALNLNELLKQRNDLEESYAEQVFSIQSRDSIQRRVSSGVETGLQLAQAKKQYQDQKNSLDYQIAQTLQKVTVEKQVFKIATDTATLQKESLALQLADTEKLKQQYLDIQNILAATAGLKPGSNGQFPGTDLLPGVAPIPGFGGTSAKPPATRTSPEIAKLQALIATITTSLEGGKFASFGGVVEKLVNKLTARLDSLTANLPSSQPAIPVLGTAQSAPISFGDIYVTGNSAKEVADGLQRELANRFRYGHAAY
jgi:hypothetical protein